MPNNRIAMVPNQQQPPGSSANSSMFQSNLDPSVSTSNPMLRNHLEQPMGQQSKLVHQLQHPNKPPTSVMSSIASSTPSSSGQSMLLSQLAKQPTSDPNPNIINEVAGGLASKVPNETLPGLLSQQRSGLNNVNSSDASMMDIKPEIKQESNDTIIKQEPMDSSAQDIKPIIKQEDIKQEIKKEPQTSTSGDGKEAKPLLEKGKNKVTFSPEELRRALEPPLNKLYNQVSLFLYFLAIP
jgi:hypothetical protein